MIKAIPVHSKKNFFFNKRLLFPFLSFHNYYEYKKNESQWTDMKSFVHALAPYMDVDLDQLNEIVDNVPIEDPYIHYEGFMDDALGNVYRAELSDEDITVSFDVYRDGVSEIGVRGSKVFHKGLASDKDYKKPSWLKDAYNIAYSHKICFQDSAYADSQYMMKQWCKGHYFHLGTRLPGKAIDIFPHPIICIRNAQERLTTLLEEKKLS